MPFQSLNELENGSRLSADLLIVGGGACGLTLARTLSGQGKRIILLESGGWAEDADHEALNRVEMDGWSSAELSMRERYHANLTGLWAGENQGYGVRCRGLGGSTQAWAGKSVPLDSLDYQKRDWIPYSGWPFAAVELQPYVEAAAKLLNLGQPVFDERVWEMLGRRIPSPRIEGEVFRTIFWQFARSRYRQTDMMRFGSDFRANPPPDVKVLLNATVTNLLCTENGRAITGVETQSLLGRKATLHAPICVLAAGAIENARLLLMSRDRHANGVGNARDQVGRYLMDHPTATVAHAAPGQAKELAARFGLFGHREGGRIHVHMYGVALTEGFQKAEHTLNGAVFVTEERMPDDPFAALRRLLRRQSKSRLSDASLVLRNPVLLARGSVTRALDRGYIPEPVAKMLADTALRFFPNTVARDFSNGRLPVKLAGLRFEATTEQPPCPQNRIILSDRRDPFGLPVPRAIWTPGAEARSNLLRIGRHLCDSFDSAGLPPLAPAPWISQGLPGDATVMDLGHSLGTTRMSDDPATGVVDRNCEVHDVSGLFIAGGSVFPTSGHANPTLTMLALSLRLAEHLKKRQD
ncbi:GMC oxidoreductase [Ruegeria aquimaris]|uniref:GMC family oxidoreductase n=1 Tax=Ruegeria aquimaris TaxID=2984333 RepID=A0ABT3ADW1_9RHOB|nr:GMC family oxidoreductase [Ruegeria sp. XHP0148]MCV2886864.1 GMC family oxidoreductase [Ruegeria sp. XHP0148]